LVIGGTQYVGRLLIEHLLQNDLSTITMLNRGDSENPFESNERVKHVKVDRHFGEEHEFEKVLEGLGYMDVVIDFSALHGVHLVDVVKRLGGKIGHYIFISCGTVYYFDPLAGSGQKLKEKPLKTPEEASIESIELEGKFGKDLYISQGKLSAENFLLDMWKKNKFPATILRLPDIVGPYDNKGRHLAIQLSLTRDQPIGIKGSQKFSVIWAKDVVSAINETIEEGPKTLGKILNIAGDEEITTQEYAEKIGAELKLTPKFDSKRMALLPSIKSGPLDNGFAKRLLNNWYPTPIDTWLPELVLHYKIQDNIQYTAKLISKSIAEAEKARKEDSK